VTKLQDTRLGMSAPACNPPGKSNPAATAGEMFAVGQTFALISLPYKGLKPEGHTDLMWAALRGGFQT